MRLQVRHSQDLRHFLAERLRISGRAAKNLIDTRTVLVNHERVWIAAHQLRRLDVVEVPDTLCCRPVPESGQNTTILIAQKGKGNGTSLGLTASFRPPAVIYEDEQLIAVNKPAGVVSCDGPGSVEEQVRLFLRQRAGESRKGVAEEVRAVHRLDRGTTGVLLLAKTERAACMLMTLWRAHKVIKTYLALCHGPARFRRAVMDKPVDGRAARSVVRFLKTTHDYSLVQVEARTGRRHQVRLHLRRLCHPVVGDSQYGPMRLADPHVREVARPMLHCYRIAFPAASEGHVVITAPLPPDFLRVASLLGLRIDARRFTQHARGPVLA
ncbi:MAG: RluA family pseudouridine synthase [candidate division WOR-3 bacterium]